MYYLTILLTNYKVPIVKFQKKISEQVIHLTLYVAICSNNVTSKLLLPSVFKSSFMKNG